MLIKRILSNRGLFIAVTVSLVLFFCFIAASSYLNSSLLKDVRQIDALSSLTNQLDSSISKDQFNNAIKRTPNLGSGLDDVLNRAKNSLASNNVDQARSTMNSELSQLSAQNDKRSRLISYSSYAWALIALFFYVFVIYPMLGRLSQDTDVKEESTKQAQGILNTVSEGLFLLGPDHEIGVEQSASLKEMFRLERDLDGNFFDFIGNYVPQNTVQIAKDFLDLLYGDRVKEKLVQDLNPLNKVEISIARRDGSFESRYLDFRFNRVLEDGVFSHLLGSVTDVTREVVLEQQLQDSKDEQAAQMDLLMSILHVDSAQLDQYFEHSDDTLTDINKTLEAKGHGNSEIRSKLAGIKKQVHRIKGDAAALGLHNFEFKIHEFEESLVAAESAKEVLSGSDLIPAVTNLKVLFEELQNMRGLVSRVASAVVKGDGPASGDDTSADDQVPLPTNTQMQSHGKIESALHRLVSTVAERNEKRANLNLFGLGDDEVPEQLQETVQSVAVQLLRNSVVHGSLLPEQRIASNKTDFINIAASFSQSESGYHLIIRDDGEGFDEKAIINQALEKGLIDAEKAKSATSNDVLKLVFSPQFSTAVDSTLDAGRGEGLGAVLTMVKSEGGSINVKHRHKQFCQFKINLPAIDA